MHKWLEVEITGIDKAKKKLYEQTYDEVTTKERKNELKELLDEISRATTEIRTKSEDVVFELDSLRQEAKKELEELKEGGEE